MKASVVHQSFGEFVEWHPHWHTIVLEGGFDCHDRFFFIPIGASEALSEVWRLRLPRTVSGEGPAEARVALSLEKIHWDEEQDTVGWKSAPKGYFKGKERHFSCLDFIAQVTLHIPPGVFISCAATVCTPVPCARAPCR